MISLQNNDTLSIDYTEKTNQVSYCIADFSGNVLMRGSLDELRESTLSINNLKKGMYTFCIIDGDSLISKRFQKA